MDQNQRVQEIQRMKQELQAHYARFKALREAGRHGEALEQFNVTLKAASDLMETSTRVLKELAAGPASPAPAVDGPVRVLHMPKVHRTH